MSGAPVFTPDVYDYSTPETAAEVGTIQASDPDGDYLSFWISAGNEDGHFQIQDDGTGASATIVVDPINPLDFETQPNTFVLTVVADDMFGNTDTATVTVNVTDVAENPVFSPATYSFDVPEVGTTVGTVTATDPQSDYLVFSIIAGNDAGQFQIQDDGTGTSATIVVDDFNPLDFETLPNNYVLTVVADDGYGNTDTATVTVNVTDVFENEAPFAVDDEFDYPDSGVEYVDIDVLWNDWDLDGDELTIQSVTSPSDGGTVEIITDSAGYQKIRFRPPASYNSSDPTIDEFSLGTTFQYTVADPFGAVAQAQVQAAAKSWTSWREYSRGNDDPDENLYETAKIKVDLIIDGAQNNISLKYTATSTTNSMLRWYNDPNDNIDWPVFQNVTSTPNAPGAMPEFEIYQPFLFLQPVAGNGVVPANAAGVNIGFNNGELSAQIEVGTWPANFGEVSGKAVVQMRYYEAFVNNQWRAAFTDPEWFTNNPNIQTRLVYGPVREEIVWTAKFRDLNGAVQRGAILFLTEIPLSPARVATPLRIIDTSHRPGEVWKIGYPAHPGVARKDFDPDEAGVQDDPNTPGDQRNDPATPLLDWNTIVKAYEKL